MMEHVDSLIRAEWDALMEREREAEQEGADDPQSAFVLDRIVEVHNIVEAKVGPVETDRIVEAGRGVLPQLDALLRARRERERAWREREREAALVSFWDSVWRMLERTVKGDENVAAEVGSRSVPYLELAKRAGEQPGPRSTVNQVVLAIRNNPPAHDRIEEGINKLERDGFYDSLWTVAAPLEHLELVFHLHRIEDAFDAALKAATEIEDDAARKKAREGLRGLRNMHLNRRRRSAPKSA